MIGYTVVLDGMAVPQILTVLLSGLSTGFGYAILVIGIILVFRVSGMINFAYGELGGIGTLAAFFMFARLGIPIGLSIVIGLIMAALLSAASEGLLMRHLGEVGSSGRDLLVTLGLLLVLIAAAQEIFGVTSNSLPGMGANAVLSLWSIHFTVDQLVEIAFGIFLAVGTFFVVFRTGLGLKLRAASIRPDVASSVGINVRLTRLLVWVVAGIMSGIGAMFFGSQLSADPTYMTQIIITVFVVAMLGGLENYWTPIFVAIGFGVVDSAVQYFFGANSAVPVTFLLAIAVLMLVPARLVGERELERA